MFVTYLLLIRYYKGHALVGLHLEPDQIAAENRIVDASREDPKAFGTLYERYFEVIFNYVYRRTGDEHLASDLTSQTFFQALQNLDKYTFKSLPFSAWLYRIASNEINKYYRKTKRKMIFSVEEDMVVQMVSETDVDVSEWRLKLLIDSLAELDSQVLEVLELRFYEEKSFNEIAFILSMTESGAKMRTYRALDKLRSIMQTGELNNND